MKKWLNIIGKGILCVIASVGSTLTFNYNMFVSLVLLFIVLFLSFFGKREDKRVRAVSFSFSLLYSLVYIIGDAIYNVGIINILYIDFLAIVTTFLEIVGVLYLLYLVNYYFFSFIERFELKRRENKILDKSYIFLYVWLLIFLLWIPCFLSYYPGIYSYDITKQVNEIFSWSWSKFHPPIHTGVVAIAFLIANYLKIEMVSVYAIMQMIFLSYACTKLIKFLYIKTRNLWVFLISFIFISLNPIMAIISLIPTKDVYFAGFLLLLIPDLYELIYNKDEFLNKKFNMIKIIFFFLMAMLFRNNASYVFFIFFIVLGIMNYKCRKIILICLISFGLYLGVNNLLYSVIGIRDGNNREKLSLPMMQIAYVVEKHEDELTDEEIKSVEKYMSIEKIKSKFNPRFADPIKSNFKTSSYDDNPTDFYKLYVSLGVKYLDDYISAFLNLNIPYWFVGAETLDEYSKREYLETGIYKNAHYFFERDSKLPELYKFYERFAKYDIEKEYFILDIIYAIKLPVWLMIFAIFVAILKRHYKSILVLLPLILLWLTYLLGPVSNFRYVIPIYMLYPMVIYLILRNKRETK